MMMVVVVHGGRNNDDDNDDDRYSLKHGMKHFHLANRGM